jgi:four helix bundle protein
MREHMKAHHKLNVWQRAIDLVTDIYKLTEEFPKEEIYGLTSQMRRAAVSIPSNIAEGAARGSKAEFRKFLAIAQGSISELETQIIISSKLGFCTTEEGFLSELDEISRMIVGLRKSV